MYLPGDHADGAASGSRLALTARSAGDCSFGHLSEHRTLRTADDAISRVSAGMGLAKCRPTLLPGVTIHIAGVPQ
jgi:hypothetical protein